MSLRDYARKRRFEQTPEPSAEQAAGPVHRPIFVVQLHHASSRHYDFRLEMDGVLKSWAVPKGPSLRKGEKRLAVEVEDHPLDYAGFEGDIPAGNYGAGHVDIFDQGHWACAGDPLASLAAGKIDFTLSGDKLGGGWKLVRTAMRGKQRQWLLVKRDDDHAADIEADDLVNARSDKSGKRESTGSTTRASKRTSNSRWKKRAVALDGGSAGMPVGFEAQLASPRSKPPVGEPWLHEIKWDGYRLMADLVDGKASLRSRGGLDWNSTFPEVAAAVEQLPVDNACLDGELVVLDADARSDFSELQRVIDGSSRATLRYLVFDLVGLAGVDLSGVTLVQRKQLLKDLLEGTDSLLAFSDHIEGHGADFFSETRRQGIEGVVSKRSDSTYRAGRSQDWIKSKHGQTDEFVVVGFTAPKGARTGFGSLLLAARESAGLRYVGRVGTGFDDNLLRSLHQQLRKLECHQAAVALPEHVPFSAKSIHWVTPKLVVEVAFRGWAKEGLLRQSSFTRLREDKYLQDLVVPEKMEYMSKVSHPDRRMFADCDYTKGDVADYYRKVAKWILPELAHRPLSLLRCPDGSEQPCFFQKHHAESFGAEVHPVPLEQKRGTEAYMYVDSVEGLIGLVQMGTIELHPWGCRVDKPELPDRLVFDLDPGPGVTWKQVIAAARDVRDKLKLAQLKSFVRLSGGKGVHVVVPLTRGSSWDEVHAFCEAFALTMAQQAPDIYVATMSKSARAGRIFIDWLRNARGATSVASWSLRARPGAPVAVPLRWEDLGRVDRPGAFDLARALSRAARLKRPPWNDFAKLKQGLPR